MARFGARIGETETTRRDCEIFMTSGSRSHAFTDTRNPVALRARQSRLRGRYRPQATGMIRCGQIKSLDTRYHPGRYVRQAAVGTDGKLCVTRPLSAGDSKRRGRRADLFERAERR